MKVKRQGWRFRDRADAGRRLAAAISAQQTADGIVYGIPRGGVPVAIEVARRLTLCLECAIVRRIALPSRPNRTAAAVTEAGDPLLSREELRDVDSDWLRRRVLEERREARRCRKLYTSGRPPPATGRPVIVVDDFVVSGLSLRAAARELQAQRPARLVIAVPWAAAGATEALAHEADELIVLAAEENDTPGPDSCYERLPELSEGEVVTLLRAFARGE